MTIQTISRYDAVGPAWYWNTLTFGEHTGTHFDAAVQWVTGKNLPDYSCDTIPARQFVGSACPGAQARACWRCGPTGAWSSIHPAMPDRGSTGLGSRPAPLLSADDEKVEAVYFETGHRDTR